MTVTVSFTDAAYQPCKVRTSAGTFQAMKKFSIISMLDQLLLKRCLLVAAISGIVLHFPAEVVIAGTAPSRPTLEGVVYGWGDTMLPNIAPATHFAAVGAGGRHNVALRATVLW